MKIRDTGLNVELLIRSQNVLTILVRGRAGRVWSVLHDSFKAVRSPEKWEMVGPMTVTTQTFAELAPDPEDTPDESYAATLRIGNVPEGYRQEYPDGEAPVLEAGEKYFVRVWTTDETEGAVFTKK